MGSFCTSTHHFLEEEDILYFKPLVLNQYFKTIKLRAYRNEKGEIIGFIGVAGDQVEMLFIHPESRSKGIGKKLLSFVIKHLKVRSVDINEDNSKAVEFYKHISFKIKNRSEFDGSGKPYPILHIKFVK